MNKIMLLLSLAIVFNLFAACAGEKQVTEQQLPVKAQKFIKSNFAGKQVSMVTVDTDLMDGDYEVLFADGTKIEFTDKGIWKKVDCGNVCVPVSVVPEKIAKYVASSFGGICITEIGFDKEIIGSSYGVELQNGIELKFDKNGKFIKMDD